MVEVTQADRNFAAPWIAQSVQSFSERSAYRKEIEAGEHDAHPMVIAAATHRIEAAKAERDRIVAWLREQISVLVSDRAILLLDISETDGRLSRLCDEIRQALADALESQP